MTKPKRRFLIALALVLIFGPLIYVGIGYGLSRALETKGLRRLLSGKTAKVLDCNAGYLPLTSHGRSVRSAGFLAQASPPRALTEMRAAGLAARCNLNEIWHAKWKIDNLSVAHLQAAYGENAARNLDRHEFRTPEIFPPLLKESPMELDLRKIDIARTDLFWGTTPEAGGEFRGVHTEFFPRDKNLIIQASGGTFHQAKWPAAQVEQVKLFYAKPNLRVDQASLTLGGDSAINVLGTFAFEEQQSLDLQLTLSRCPIAPFLNDDQKSKFDGQFDGNVHLQKDASQTQSARAIGTIAFSKALLKNIAALKRVADFTGRQEFAHMEINQLKGDFDWNFPVVTAKNVALESKGLISLKGQFTMKQQNVEGEFELGAAPDLVEKFPGAREEVFTREEGGYLWTKLKLSGPLDHLRDDLKPRLVTAVRNHFAKGLLAPILKPGKNIIQAIEEL